MSGQISLYNSFFDTSRGINTLGAYKNLDSGGQPDAQLFRDLLETTFLKKVDSNNFQDVSTHQDIIAGTDNKIVTPLNLPVVSVISGLGLNIIAPTSDNPFYTYELTGASSLSGLSDVNLGTLASNEVLYYNTGSNKWENATISTILGYTPADSADLTGLATETYVDLGDSTTLSSANAYTDAKVEDTIIDGVTDKAPSQNAVFDALATKEPTITAGTTAQYWRGDKTWQTFPTPATPTLDQVTTAGNTTTNDITVGSATVSNTTASTLAFISSAKKLISATGSLLGTWFQTLTAKSTPVDADTIVVNDSASSFEAKKTTLLELWTNYIKPKTDATYNKIYLTSRYAKVDYANTPTTSGILERQDRPFADLQSAYDAIVAFGGTDIWNIEIVGDITTTSNLLTFTSSRMNFVFNFQGKVTSSIVNSTATKGVFSANGYTISDIVINFNNVFNQTTNVGLGLESSGSNIVINFNKSAILKHPKGSVDGYGIYLIGSNNSFYAKNLTCDITNDSGVTPYWADVFQIFGSGTKVNIENMIIQGTANASCNIFHCSNANSIVNIDNIYLNHTMSSGTFSINEVTGVYGYYRIGNLQTKTNASATSSYIISASSIEFLQLDNYVSNLNYDDIRVGTLKTLITGTVKTNGRFLYNTTSPFAGTWINRGVFESTRTTGFQNWLAGGCLIQGGKFLCNLPYNSNTSLFFTQNSSSKYSRFKNCSFYNSGITANSTEGNPIIRYSSTNQLIIIKNCEFSGTAGNTNTSTNVIKSEGDNTGYTCIVEGDYMTLYNGTLITGLTNYSDIKQISNLQI